jgi:hypothetical protein
MTNLGGVPPQGKDPMRTSLLILAAATLLVYSVTLFNKFVQDDEVIIVNNPQTLSLRNVPEVMLAPDIIKPYYRPLSRATYLLDYRIAGMNPAWYHGVNVLIHLGNVILLYLVCIRLLPDKAAALVAALIFAVHPANSEAVNFISARNTLLALFFSLASFLAFLEARGMGKRLPLLSALFFFCGLLSKETAFMLVGVIALYTFVSLQGGEKRVRLPEGIFFLLPYLVSTVLYFMMRYSSLQGIVGVALPSDGVFSRLARNYHVIPQYLGLLLFPVDLTVFHKAPQGGLLTPPLVPPGLAFADGSSRANRTQPQPDCPVQLGLDYHQLRSDLEYRADPERLDHGTLHVHACRRILHRHRGALFVDSHPREKQTGTVGNHGSRRNGVCRLDDSAQPGLEERSGAVLERGQK